MGLKTGILGGGGKLTWNRFTGPGGLAIQTHVHRPARGRRHEQRPGRRRRRTRGGADRAG